MRTEIACAEADRIRANLRPLSSCTNFVGGEVLNPMLPPHTSTTWGNDSGTELLEEILDASGCRHYRIDAA